MDISRWASARPRFLTRDFTTQRSYLPIEPKSSSNSWTITHSAHGNPNKCHQEMLKNRLVWWAQSRIFMLLCQCFSPAFRKERYQWKRNLITIKHNLKHLFPMLVHVPMKGQDYSCKVCSNLGHDVILPVSTCPVCLQRGSNPEILAIAWIPLP